VWEQVRQRRHLFESATAWSFTRFDLASGGATEFVDGIWADGGFFDALGVPPLFGRTFSALDDQPGGGPHGPVAVISYGYWQAHFGGADDTIGRSLQLNGVPFTIVGVTPQSFFGVEVGRSFDVVVPLRTESLVRGGDSALTSASTNFLSILARLRPGQSAAVAAAELRRVQAEIRDATLGPWSQDVVDRYLTSPFTVVPAVTGYSNLRSSYDQALVVVAAIVALVLLVGCLNVANLLLARAIDRRHQMCLQLALGASRWRLARQLLAEGATLSAAGGLLGVLIAPHIGPLLVRQLSTPTSTVFLDVSIDGAVLAFTAAISVLTALVSGTVPAFRAARIGPAVPLQSQGRAAVGHGRSRLMGSLVVVQVALSVVLLVAAGLFVRSFTTLADKPLGLQPVPVLVVTVDPRGTTTDAAERVALYERVREAVLALPNVAEAAISHLTPVGGGGFTPPLEIAGMSSPATEVVPQLVPADGDVFGNLVSSGWFGTFGTPLIAGRDFREGDRRGALSVAIVNETFVRRFFSDDRAIGRRITVYPNSPRAVPAEIIGVVGDAVYSSPRESAPPAWYMSLAQFDRHPLPFARLSIRTSGGSPESLTKSVEAAVSAVDPRLSLTFRPLADQIRSSLRRERLMAQLAGSLGLLAWLLAGLGLYGVAAYAVSRRRTEIAVRMALGARPGTVIALVLGRVAALVGVGVAAGAGISYWASQFADTLIYGIPPRDPLTLVSAGLLLCAMGALASWLPARRAARTDPVAVLREG
jgi:predicted permease